MADNKSKQIKPAPADFPALYAQLCETMAQVLEHPQCPRAIGEHLATCVSEISNATDVHDSATYARYLLPAVLPKLKGKKAK